MTPQNSRFLKEIIYDISLIVPMVQAKQFASNANRLSQEELSMKLTKAGLIEKIWLVTDSQGKNLLKQSKRSWKKPRAKIY